MIWPFNRRRDFYQRLRRRINRWMKSKAGRNYRYGEYLLCAPDLFHVLVKLSMDERVPNKHKGMLLAAIVYFVSPIDVLPEGVLGPVGFVDDIAVAAYVLNRLINRENAKLVRDEWAGEQDVLEVVQGILRSVDDMIGSGLWEKIKKRIR